ncbi:MAG: energy-coupling factor transporter ATPase [Clostridia bacterium]|nr:energy-coupling factor transporter ATPase [Clostridia bacterium]
MPIQVEHLYHTYLPGSPFSAVAVHDISMTVEDGEFLGILGHTGSGKTTLIQHFNGLLKPTAGRVLVDGLDITPKGISLLELRKKVGMVFQYPEHQLFEETVAKDIAFGPKNLGLAKETIEERVREACRQVQLDYDAIGQRSPFELSGGQMRKVAIAGVMAMHPRVLVLDEPAAGLDPSGRRGILNMIRTLHAQGGLTVIMVSHNMDDIASMATRLVVMSKGSLVMTGTPREIFVHEEQLRSIGLGVPQPAELTHALIAEGFDLPSDLYTLAEVRDHLLRIFQPAPQPEEAHSAARSDKHAKRACSDVPASGQNAGAGGKEEETSC